MEGIRHVTDSEHSEKPLEGFLPCRAPYLDLSVTTGSEDVVLAEQDRRNVAQVFVPVGGHFHGCRHRYYSGLRHQRPQSSRWHNVYP